MSHILYKFKAAKEYSKLPFDGLHISVFDLKQEILKAKKLNVDEFDVVISNAQTNEDYTSDRTQIPKNSFVFVRRVPRHGPKMSTMYSSSAGASAPPVMPPSMPSNVNYSMSSSAVSMIPSVNTTSTTITTAASVGGSMLPGLSSLGASKTTSIAQQHYGGDSSGSSAQTPILTSNEQDNMQQYSTNSTVTDSAEDNLIDAMFQRTSEHWEHQQKQMEKYALLVFV